MEVWLKLEEDNINFRFPVIPQEFEKQISKDINSSKVIKKGEVNSYGGKNASSIPISSFFPKRYYPYCSYSDFPGPYECVAIIEDMINKDKIPRLIITDTNINMLVLIEDFSYSKKEGDGSGDIYFSISFREYIKIDIPIIVDTSQQATTDNTERASDKNSSPASTQVIHTVKHGDCLWDIAQKYLGKGSLYPKIKEANWNTYTSLKKNNVIYSDWKLVIPKV